MTSNQGEPQPRSRAWFVTTHWSVVLAAGDKADPRCRVALQTLCRTYWYPLYAYVRQKGYAVQDAEDLTQSFFAFLLEKDRLGSLVRDKGKFRSFLLTALNHFVTDQWKRASTARRGGGRTVLSLDMSDAEARFLQEPVDRITPEVLFEQNWAVTLLNTVFDRLQEEQRGQGKAEQFSQLRFCLTGRSSEVPYARLAERLGATEASIKVLVLRLRRHYRDLLQEEISHTVATPEEVQEELQYLMAVLSA